MKKLALLLLISTFSISLIAQNVVQRQDVVDKETGMMKDYKTPKIYTEATSDFRADRAEWYNFTVAFNEYLGGGLSFTSSILFPDSSCVVPYSDGAGGIIMDHYGWHSFGQVFDPTSDIFAFNGDHQLLANQPYKLDSVFFFYFYDKYNDNSIKDELVLKFYQPDGLSYWSFQNGTIPFATAAFTRAPFESIDEAQEVVLELDYEDTNSITGGYYGIMSVDVSDLQIPYKGQDGATPTAMTMTFVPGYNYSLGDTLGVWSGATPPIIPEKKLNTFRTRRAYDETNTNHASYNNGIFVNIQMRYEDAFGDNFGTKYLPGNAWANPYYTYVWFKILFDDEWEDAIEELDNNVQVSDVYPNPSNTKALINISLENTEDVKIELINPLGQTVKTVYNNTLTPGQHEIDLNIQDLNGGVYYARVSSGNSFVTKTVVVR